MHFSAKSPGANGLRNLLAFAFISEASVGGVKVNLSLMSSVDGQEVIALPLLWLAVA